MYVCMYVYMYVFMYVCDVSVCACVYTVRHSSVVFSGHCILGVVDPDTAVYLRNPRLQRS